MHCPVCRSEFRKGIEECASCGVALVAELPRSGASAPGAPPPARVAQDADPVDVLVEHCGFLSLEDARQARETLRHEGIPSEILIRDAGGDNGSSKPEEEYWLRVPARRRAEVEQFLEDFDSVEPAEGAAAQAAQGDAAAVACSDCGKPVAEDENICPHCGAQFE